MALPSPDRTAEKARSLRRHKQAATGLFLLMVIIYVVTAALEPANGRGWLGAVNAFSEAAMVGALADWFAVTALFHHPLGLPIPHTDLIEHSKARIGANLGDFVVGNFLTPATIRPYLGKLQVAGSAGDWLAAPAHRQAVLAEASRLLADVLRKLDDRAVVRFISRKGSALLSELDLPALAAGALDYAVRRGEHEAVVTLLAQKAAGFVADNGELVRERVKAESLFFIPGFVNDKLAAKIGAGLVGYFEEIATDENHRIRQEVTEQLLLLAERLRTEPEWRTKFDGLRASLLSPEKLQEHAEKAWISLKETVLAGLTGERSPVLRYLDRTLGDLADTLRTDAATQQKIDGWVRYTAYRAVLRHRDAVGGLISNTVGAWEGRALSQKLELEVGRDLQFIRINGTVVGGLVGLLIHALTVWLR